MAVRIESQAEPIPGYKLIERLGGGGFGEVWKVEAPGGLHKAIKFVFGDLKTASEDGQRAEQELKALSRVKSVRHPYILSLERYDIIEGQLLIVMELADRNLWDRFRECRSQGHPGIPREELLRYMEETAEALDLMNIEHQLQHLDIKPQNLFLVHNHAKVADFGLVKDLEGVMASVTGGVTPVYAAPETFDGWVSRFCDQYSLAIVYQELLTGQRPFNGTNVRQLIMQHLQAAPNLAPLKEGDQECVARALAKNPDDRFRTCLDFVQALRRGQAGSSPVIEKPANALADSGSAQSGSHSESNPENISKTAVISQRSVRAEDTPKPGAGGPSETHWIRVLSVPKAEEDEAPESPPAEHKEVRGDGLLFPALVVGLGSLGLKVMLHLRHQIQEEFGSLELFTNIRWLYMDTDAEAVRLATAVEQAARLNQGEVLLTKLNRPGHYMRAGPDRPHIESWFDLKMLYRIPRSLQTMGMRVLGRLAFMDNYRLITRRLRSELQACTDPETLTQAAEQSGLGVRTNHPKVYLVAGLAGGTGGGMFLDTAYVIRSLLERLGYRQPDVVGTFLLPTVDRQPNRTLALGNTFAALTELNHFSSPSITFSARYEEKQKPLTIREAPFSRCILVELPPGLDERAENESLENTADLLRREMTTPLGRVAEESRQRSKPDSFQPRELTCQVFGLQRISWPRRALIRNAASRLCRQLVARWSTKDASALKETVDASVAELWARQKLDGESLMHRLQSACEKKLEKTVDAAFAAALEPLANIEVQPFAAQFACVGATIDQIEHLVGRVDTSAGARQGEVVEPLNEAADDVIARWGQRLASLPFLLLEQPKFRLAGAEEALRQMINKIEQTLVHHEVLAKELSTRSVDAGLKMREFLAHLHAPQPGSRKPPTALLLLVELLNVYPRWRFQSLVLQRLTNVYISLRGRLSDQLREINYCRARLVELQRNFETACAQGQTATSRTAQRQIFPPGCGSMADAVKQLAEGTSAAELELLDSKVQELIQGKFTGLAHVCMSSANMLDDLEQAMQKQVESFVSERLAGHNIPEMYFAQIGGAEQACEDLNAAFTEAAPALADLGNAEQPEICVLGVPEGPASQPILDCVQEALPDVELANSNAPNDILFYREVSHLPVSELEQLGPLAYEAYRQVSAVDHFTPHSRVDIVEWRAATAG